MDELKNKESVNPTIPVIIIPWVNECQRLRNIFTTGLRDAVERSWKIWDLGWRMDLNEEDKTSLIERYIELDIIFSCRYLKGYILYIQDPSLAHPMHKFLRKCITSAGNKLDKWHKQCIGMSGWELIEFKKNTELDYMWLEERINST